jgi:hypothetical protein
MQPGRLAQRRLPGQLAAAALSTHFSHSDFIGFAGLVTMIDAASRALMPTRTPSTSALLFIAEITPVVHKLIPTPM